MSDDTKTFSKLRASFFKARLALTSRQYKSSPNLTYVEAIEAHLLADKFQLNLGPMSIIHGTRHYKRLGFNRTWEEMTIVANQVLEGSEHVHILMFRSSSGSRGNDTSVEQTTLRNWLRQEPDAGTSLLLRMVGPITMRMDILLAINQR